MYLLILNFINNLINYFYIGEILAHDKGVGATRPNKVIFV